MRVGNLYGALTALCAVTAALLVSSTPALAVSVRPFLFSFKVAGGLSDNPANPNGIAVDSSGDVYVADIANNRVEKFDATGTPVNSFAGGTTNELTDSFSFLNPAAVAIDNSGLSTKGYIYVIDYNKNVIDRFKPDGTPANFIAPEKAGGTIHANTLTGAEAPGGPFSSTNALYGLAVDASGNVWVRTSENTGSAPNVYEFEPTGEFHASCETGRATAPGFAVNSLDHIYWVSEGQSTYTENSSCLPFQGTEVDTPASTVAVAVDGSDNVYVDRDKGGSPSYREVVEYDSSGNPIVQFGSTQLSITNSGGLGEGGIAVSPVAAKENVYVSNPHDGKVYVFGPLVPLPEPTTGSASNEQPTSATLKGEVNPEGVPLTKCFFEYDTSEYTTSAPHGTSVPCAQTLAQIEAGTPPVPVSANISGLQPNTTYYFRLVAENAYGRGEGADKTFLTPGPPAIDGESSSGVTKTEATLEAQINPDSFDTTCHFEYGTNPSYGTSVSCSPEDLGAGIGGVAAPPLLLTGLTPGTTYRWRVVAHNSAGLPVYGHEQTFTTLPVAQFDSVTISNVGPSGASVSAEVNPLGPEGGDTTCHFEYGTDTGYGTSVPCTPEDLGEANGDVAVTLSLSGLSANTTYHVRVVAHNTTGTAYSGDHAFVYDTNGAGLPDNRAYEMVTPPQKNGASIGTCPFCVPWRPSEGGSRVVAMSVQPFAGSGSGVGIRNEEGERYAFTRTSGGWVTEPLAPSATRFETNTNWGASADAGTALFSIPTPPAMEDDFYAREPGGSFLDVGPATPPAEGAALPLPGPRSTTADLSHIVYRLGLHHWPFDHTSSGYSSTYEYVGAGHTEPVLVGVSGPRGSTDLISACETVAGGERSDSNYNALSTEGGTSTVFFTAVGHDTGGCPAGAAAPATNELLARIDESRTVAISQPSPNDECTTSACTGSPPGDAEFEGASRDGSKVLFTDTQQLTDNASEDSSSDSASAAPGVAGKHCPSTTGANGCNLYLYDFANPAGHNLVAVSAGDSSGFGPEVRGVVAISPGGSHAYFVAGGVLTAEPNAQDQTASANADNLYVYERDARYPAGHTTFVATLPPSDESEWESGVGVANVTPDGRFLVFTSHADLTPDDTSTTGAAQVFRYDAQTGELVRISIGERGYNDNGNAGVADAAEAGARIVGLRGLPVGPTRSDPTMSHDGAYVFFQSPAGLTPQALNDRVIAKKCIAPLKEPECAQDIALGFEELLIRLKWLTLTYAQNVYEYHDGHVSLISDGRDTAVFGGSASAVLVGADGTGANVFFTTDDALVPQDTDTGRDIYDARICTSAELCIQSPSPAVSCRGDACQGTPGAQPVFGTGASLAFSGAGNLSPPALKKPVVKSLTNAQKLARALKACGKRPKSQRKRCVSKARKRYGAKRASKSRRSK
jgi:sugar lactone lactonase YvrE